MRKPRLRLIKLWSRSHTYNWEELEEGSILTFSNFRHFTLNQHTYYFPFIKKVADLGPWDVKTVLWWKVSQGGRKGRVIAASPHPFPTVVLTSHSYPGCQMENSFFDLLNTNQAHRHIGPRKLLIYQLCNQTESKCLCIPRRHVQEYSW